MTRVEELEGRIRPLGSCIVAFSGGVDSSLVAALAARALGDRALAVTAVSSALATGELDGAREVAHAIGIRHETITTAELEREERVVEVAGGRVRVKIGILDGRVVNVAPEHDDCAELARATGRAVKSIWAEALARAQES